RLTLRLAKTEGVKRVDSLATAPRIRSADGVVEIGDFLEAPPEDLAAALALREEALANPLLRGPLVSPDGRGALVAVHPDSGLSPRELMALGEAVAAAAR